MIMTDVGIVMAAVESNQHIGACTLQQAAIASGKTIIQKYVATMRLVLIETIHQSRFGLSLNTRVGYCCMIEPEHGKWFCPKQEMQD